MRPLAALSWALAAGLVAGVATPSCAAPASAAPALPVVPRPPSASAALSPKVSPTVSPTALNMAPPQRLFISGHSLIDQPIPGDLARIAESLGQTLQWNRQYVVGSSIKQRTRGVGHETGWAGYRSGYNRDGEGLDVVQELRHPRTTDGQPYDTLLITEQHGLLESLVSNDTVGYLRHYHDRFIDGNPQGRTWFYVPWLGVIDKTDPRRWIAYEREAAPVWQCIVTRINTSLAAEGRTDRLQTFRASSRMVDLVERAQRGELPELGARDTAQLMARLFHDTVHPSPVSAYYLALSLYAGLYGRSPLGAWAPDTVPPALARALQRIAWQVTQAEQAAPPEVLPLARCQAAVDRLRPTYFAHVRDDYWAQQPAGWRTTWRRLRGQWEWRWRVWRQFDGDLFRYDADHDKKRWFPAP